MCMYFLFKKKSPFQNKLIYLISSAFTSSPKINNINTTESVAFPFFSIWKCKNIPS